MHQVEGKTVKRVVVASVRARDSEPEYVDDVWRIEFTDGSALCLRARETDDLPVVSPSYCRDVTKVQLPQPKQPA